MAEEIVTREQYKRALAAEKERLERELAAIKHQEYLESLPPEPELIESTTDLLGQKVKVGDKIAMGSNGRGRSICVGLVSRLSEARVTVVCDVHDKKCVGMLYKIVKV